MELKLHQTMFEKAPIGLAYCEVILNDDQNIIDLVYIDVNDTFKHINKINKENIHQSKRSEIFPNKTIDVELATHIRTAITGQVKVDFRFYSDVLNRHLKGSVYGINHNKILIFVSDMTEEINESIEKSIFLKTMSDIIFELDEEYNFTHVYTNNKEDLFIKENEIIRKNIKDIFSGDISQKLMTALEKAKLSQTSQIIDYQGIENNNRKYYQATIFYVEFDHENRFVVSVKDNTIQKETEQTMLVINDRLTEVAKQSRTVIWEVDTEGRYTYINSMSKDVYGYEPEEMIGHYFYHFYPDEYRLQYKEEILDLMRRHEIVSNYISPYLTKSKEKLWLISFSAPNYNEDGVFIGYRGSDMDNTEKYNIQLALMQNEEKFRFITENISDVIWILNLDNYKFTYISPAIKQLRGFSVEEAMSQHVSESMTAESWERVQEEIEQTFGEYILDPKHAKSHVLTIQQFHKNGSKIWVEVSVRYRLNEFNQIEIIGISRDITERKKVEDEILYLSFHDQLTGLYNRRFYEVELNRLNTKRNLPISFITADINGLKMTNDIFGHSFGDELIKLAAKVLKEGCREDDIIVRSGGDEFLILLPKTSIQDCKMIASRIYAKINQVKDNKLLLSMSLGYATKERIEQEILDVVNQSDKRMYQRKLIESETYKRQLLGKIMDRLYKLDTDLRRHLKSLVHLVNEFGKHLELDDDKVKQLKIASMYHDIGKIGIDENDIKLYQTNRIKYEYLLKRQPELSYQILRYISEYSEVANIVLSYHENYDGSGYPRGLSKNEISKESMIIHIINDYDKLRYNLGLNQTQAIEQLYAKKGNELEPNLVDKFCEMIVKTDL